MRIAHTPHTPGTYLILIQGVLARPPLAGLLVEKVGPYGAARPAPPIELPVVLCAESEAFFLSFLVQKVVRVFLDVRVGDCDHLECFRRERVSAKGTWPEARSHSTHLATLH